MKKISKNTWAAILAMTLAVAYVIGLIAAACGTEKSPETSSAVAIGKTMEYEGRIFDTSFVHTINISIDESDWQELKDTSIEKSYFDCNLTVDGETFYHVGVRTKGNSTLVQSMVREWDRQSLVINFGEFNASQRYYGLDKLSLYNSACDSSYLKNMVALDMMRWMGVPTPLSSFTAVYLNGEYVGLYTAMEGVDESFAYRNYGGDYGNIYKPEQYDIAALLRGDETNIVINAAALAERSDSLDISDFLQVSDSTVALQYQGDNLSLYSEIWNNSVFKIGNNDKKRLINSLKNISGGNISEYADMQELAAYFAVNTFVLNTDNYLTNMAHNYYLYEKDGVLQMLLWDYDQSLGTVGAVGDEGDITAFINTAIDYPLQNTTLEERPMLHALLSDEDGYRLYHEALQKLLNEYVYSGYFTELVEQQYALILPYVETDDLYEGTELFDEAVTSLKTIVSLRSESIQRQLDGDNTPVDASEFSCPDSGSFFNMLMPEGSGLYLDDVLDALLKQTDLISILKKMPISSLSAVAEISKGESGTLEHMIESGQVQSSENIKNIILAAAAKTVRSVILVTLSLAVLILSMVWIRHYGNKRKPKARCT